MSLVGKKTYLREGKNENLRPRVMSGDGCGDCRGYSGEDCAVNRHLFAKLKMCIVKAGKKMIYGKRKNYGIYKG